MWYGRFLFEDEGLLLLSELLLLGSEEYWAAAACRREGKERKRAGNSVRVKRQACEAFALRR